MGFKKRRPKKRWSIVWILAVCSAPLVLVSACLLIQVVTGATSTGAATVFGGVPVTLTVQGLGFSVEGHSEKTRIEAAGRVIEFLDTHEVVVDGLQIGVINESVERLALNVGRDGGTILSQDGREILAFH